MDWPATGAPGALHFLFEFAQQATTLGGELKPLRRLTGQFWLQVGYF
jgi:hypothetical protein